MEQRIGWEVALASLLLAFALSIVVAWVYSATHVGMSYLRGFTQSLAMGGIISGAIMLAIGDDVARGLGVVGALTIVRFRTTIKDTRDLMFVFASLSTGIACGVQSYAIAVVGIGVFTLAVLFLHPPSVRRGPAASPPGQGRPPARLRRDVEAVLPPLRAGEPARGGGRSLRAFVPGSVCEPAGRNHPDEGSERPSGHHRRQPVDAGLLP